MTKLREIIRKEIVNILLETDASQLKKEYDRINKETDKSFQEREKAFIAFKKLKNLGPLNSRKFMPPVKFHRELKDAEEKYKQAAEKHKELSKKRIEKHSELLKTTGKGLFSESNNIEKSKKVAIAFQNLNGFRYYGLESERNNTASIVAPSTNKKWYRQIIEKLDRLDIGNYSLDASQKPGYFILTFEK